MSHWARLCHFCEVSLDPNRGLFHEVNLLLLALDEQLHGLHGLDDLVELLVGILHLLHGRDSLAPLPRPF
jgi:hypothetical protein